MLSKLSEDDSYQYFLDNWPENEQAIQAQKSLAILNTVSGNDTAAQAAVDKLLADYSTNQGIAEVVYDVARCYHKLRKCKGDFPN